MEIKVNISESKKDVVKASNTPLTLKEFKGKQLTVDGIIMYTDEQLDENTGEVKNVVVTALRNQKDKNYISSISPTVEKSVNMILSVYDEKEIKEGIQIEVKSSKSNKNRDFIYIDLV